MTLSICEVKQGSFSISEEGLTKKLWVFWCNTSFSLTIGCTAETFSRILKNSFNQAYISEINMISQNTLLHKDKTILCRQVFNIAHKNM